jgi:pimeloyl-ACP methyl ester carboxylesterase
MARLNAAGNFHYVLHFQKPGVEAELERDVRRTLRGIYRDPTPLAPLAERPAPGVWGPAGESLLDRLPDGPLGKFMTEADLEVYVKAFEKTGFRGGLNWYRNIDRNWEESAKLADRVDQPALMITAELDFVLWPEQTLGMERWVPNLKRANIKGSGHWTQQEKPEEVNAALLEFLSDLR